MILLFITRFKSNTKQSMKKQITTLVLAAAAAVTLSNCAQPATDVQQKTLLGTGLGAAAGGIIGHQSGKTTEGVLLGGALGGGTGYLLGSN